jgi:hypothetical protein
MRTEDFVELQIAFVSAKHQKVVAEWAAFNQKRHSMSQLSRPFSALTPPSLPRAFGGALSPSTTIEDLVELQIAFLVLKHQNVVAEEWAPN